MKRYKLNQALLVGASLLALSGQAYSQDEAAAEDEEKNLDVVIVTGTSVDRTAFDTPTTLSYTGEEDLRKYSGGSGSQADFLQQVPGVSAEGGGGEVATNFTTRGLPGGGPAGFEFNLLSYDGIPVLNAFGLNSSAADFYARNDLGIERLEYVKGSAANLLGPGAPASLINYISKTGTDESHGTIQGEWAEEGRYRGDFAFQGPIADNTYYAVSGFYRRDDGPIDVGRPSEGYAYRGNIKRDFEDGSGFVQILGAYIDDRAQFYVAPALDPITLERVPGNDGADVFASNATAALDGISVPSPEGLTRYDAGDGFRTQGGSLAIKFDKEIGEGLSIDGNAKLSRYIGGSNFFFNGFPTPGGQNVPHSQTAFIADRDFVVPAGYVPEFTFAETGAVLDPDDLLLENVFLDRDRPLTDRALEFNIRKSVPLGDVTHNFTLGTYISNSEARDDQRFVQYLGEFTNNPRLVNATLVDADPTDAIVLPDQQITFNGITRGIASYQERYIASFRRAIYFADQIEGERWALDAAIRYEETTASNTFEGSSTIPSNLVPNPAATSTGLAAISTYSFGNGQLFSDEATTDGFAYSIAGLYRLTDKVNLFANYSKAFFFPQPQGLRGQIAATGEVKAYEVEPITQAEVGAKFNYDRFDGSLTAFYTSLEDRNQVTFATSSIATIVAIETEAYGVEAVGSFAVNDWLDVWGNVTLQETEFTASNNPAFVGSPFPRTPRVLANIGASVEQGAFDASVVWNHRGDIYQTAGRGVPIEGLDLVRLDAGYTFDLRGGDTMRLSANVSNLFDSIGLQEGNSRGGVVQTSGTTDSFFFGRPVLPRRVTLRLTYDF